MYLNLIKIEYFFTKIILKRNRISIDSDLPMSIHEQCPPPAVQLQSLSPPLPTTLTLQDSPLKNNTQITPTYVHPRFLRAPLGLMHVKDSGAKFSARPPSTSVNKKSLLSLSLAVALALFAQNSSAPPAD